MDSNITSQKKGADSKKLECFSQSARSLNTSVVSAKEPADELPASVAASSETQGQLDGARGNKSSKATKRHRFTSQAKKAPGNRLLPDRFQMALPMLSSDWAEKSFVLFCPIGEQQLLRYCGVFLHNDFRIAILFWFVHKHSVFEGNFHFNFPRERRNIEMMT